MHLVSQDGNNCLVAFKYAIAHADDEFIKVLVDEFVPSDQLLGIPIAAAKVLSICVVGKHPALDFSDQDVVGYHDAVSARDLDGLVDGPDRAIGISQPRVELGTLRIASNRDELGRLLACRRALLCIPRGVRRGAFGLALGA